MSKDFDFSHKVLLLHVTNWRHKEENFQEGRSYNVFHSMERHSIAAHL